MIEEFEVEVDRLRGELTYMESKHS